MPIKIVRSTDPIVTTNLIVTLYGEPGIGKTTLGFSTNKPLLLDFDKGAHRAAGRKDIIQIANWADIEALHKDDLLDYDTIIIDTVGRLLEVLATHLIATTPKLAKSTGELQLQGYGALNTAFKAFLNKIRSFGKDIILIGHSKEDKEKEMTFTRIDAMGSSKNEIIKCSDLLGYVFARDNDKYIDFNPTEAHLGKNCADIQCQKIPHHDQEKSFLDKVIAKTKEQLNKKSAEQIEAEKKFNASLELIENANSDDEFTALTLHESIKDNKALKAALLKKANTKGLEYNLQDKRFQHVQQQATA